MAHQAAYRALVDEFIAEHYVHKNKLATQEEKREAKEALRVAGDALWILLKSDDANNFDHTCVDAEFSSLFRKAAKEASNAVSQAEHRCVVNNSSDGEEPLELSGGKSRKSRKSRKKRKKRRKSMISRILRKWKMGGSRRRW